MQKIENHADVLDILKNELPKCFRRGNQKLPLALGIHEQVLKHFKNDKRFDVATLQKAVGLYCKGSKYISTIIEGAPRIDINGNAISVVKKSEESYALEVLAGRKAKKKIETTENSHKEKIQLLTSSQKVYSRRGLADKK